MGEQTLTFQTVRVHRHGTFTLYDQDYNETLTNYGLNRQQVPEVSSTMKRPVAKPSEERFLVSSTRRYNSHQIKIELQADY